jgi:hypothetical protein
MALLGAFIDSRTNAGLTSDNSLTFAHGLPASPDFVLVQYIATIATATNHFNLSALSDATNVTIDNGGSTTSPNFRVVSVVAQSIIR